MRLSACTTPNNDTDTRSQTNSACGLAEHTIVDISDTNLHLEGGAADGAENGHRDAYDQTECQTRNAYQVNGNERERD